MKPKIEQPFQIDFLSGKLRYRADHAGLKNELLARAIGKKPKDNPIIVDATAGLGRDSFILASLGFRVTMLERSNELYDLLRDALNRASEEIPEIIERLTLIHTDSISWLKTAEKPQIIYIDPMFPERKKSALVKKDMALLQQLLPKEDNYEALLECALACATVRVVVKRPRLAPSNSKHPPSYVLSGKTSRFDVYIL